MGLFLIIFLMKELPSLRLKGLIVVAIGLFFVAEAMDFIEGMDNNIFDHVVDFFSTTPGHAVHYSKSIEEFLEMVGTTVFLFVFLRKLISLTPSLTFELNPRE